MDHYCNECGRHCLCKICQGGVELPTAYKLGDSAELDRLIQQTTKELGEILSRLEDKERGKGK